MAEIYRETGKLCEEHRLDSVLVSDDIKRAAVVCINCKGVLGHEMTRDGKHVLVCVRPCLKCQARRRKVKESVKEKEKWK
jgi:peptide methionine sulfoxide reductase MsrB